MSKSGLDGCALALSMMAFIFSILTLCVKLDEVRTVINFLITYWGGK